jgi:type I restriction enzyme M protein
MAKKSSSANSFANLGFEEHLWLAADKMRNSMDPGEYKHVVLGLIFLKYISDSFAKQRQKIMADPDYFDGLEEDQDSYTQDGVFWVPAEARWGFLQNNAKKPEIGQLIDEAMLAIEKNNASLKGVLPKNYGRPDLDKIGSVS